MLGVKIHLVDGTYELFRQNFGRAAKEPDAGPFAATTGVLASTLMLLADGATHVGVASDHIIESFRNDLWPGYKTSAGMPPELLEQIPLMEESLAAMGVTVWAMVTHEADDALAAAAEIADADERVEQALIVTPDKDLGQCVRGTRIVQFDRRKRELIDEDGVSGQVRRRAGVDPRLPRPRRRLRRRLPRHRRLGGQERVGGARPLRAPRGHPRTARPVGRPGPARRGQAGRQPARRVRSWRCCSAASPPPTPTSRSAPSTSGPGTARRRSSPAGPSASANPAWPSGPPPSPRPGSDEDLVPRTRVTPRQNLNGREDPGVRGDGQAICGTRGLPLKAATSRS